MFDHVTIRVSDAEASERFYDTVMGAIGVAKRSGGFGEGCPEFADWGEFSIAIGEPTTGLHVGFAVDSRADVDRVWQTAVDAGYRSDGEPGPRPQYVEDYYGGFLLDPDGNSIEAVHYADVAEPGRIDHLWIRVADLEATRRFYETIAPYSGFEVRLPPRYPGRVHFRGPDRASFALVADSPVTQRLHLAFGAPSNDRVDAFHAAALAAGYEDNGAPGERAHYHDGYYAAFVHDPAGANVEVVCHNR
jgi:catechol 2,3-dioxygenase-like lactoylglutathione lyase family enzyme